MSRAGPEAEQLAAARSNLRAYIEGLVGPGPIPRLEEALTHPSFGNETGLPDNQRLEFLGDAVLGLSVSEMLIAAEPAADEGKLTRMRGALVNTDALAAWARRMDLGACLAFGRGARFGGDREQTSVLADATEALVAAVYDARGLAGARLLMRDITRDLLDSSAELALLDPKSELQERIQAGGLPAPKYRIVDVQGSPHEPTFEVEVVVAEKAVARGQGRSKRAAEREAASKALATLAGALERKEVKT